MPDDKLFDSMVDLVLPSTFGGAFEVAFEFADVDGVCGRGGAGDFFLIGGLSAKALPASSEPTFPFAALGFAACAEVEAGCVRGGGALRFPLTCTLPGILNQFRLIRLERCCEQRFAFRS